MDDFDALVNSLGETCVTYLRSKVKLDALSVFADDLTGTAHIEIVIPELSWDKQKTVIDQMIDVREMFLDDVSLDYVVIDGDDLETLEPTRSREADFVAA